MPDGRDAKGMEAAAVKGKGERSAGGWWPLHEITLIKGASDLCLLGLGPRLIECDVGQIAPRDLEAMDGKPNAVVARTATQVYGRPARDRKRGDKVDEIMIGPIDFPGGIVFLVTFDKRFFFGHDRFR